MLNIPIEIWLELETRCNLRCRFCYNYWKSGSMPAPPVISGEALVGGLRLLFKHVRCQKVTLSGGEPLLYKDLQRVVDFVSSQTVPMVLTTNGTLVTASKIRQLMTSGVTIFQVPLLAAQENLHDYLSGRPCWDETLAALVLMRDLGAYVVVVFVATRVNVSEMPRVIELAASIGIHEIIVSRFIPNGTGAINRAELEFRGDAEILPVLLIANDVARMTKSHINLGAPVEIDAESFRNLECVSQASCPVRHGQRRWIIGSDGAIRRCNQSAATIGNLLGDGLWRLLDELSATKDMQPTRDVAPCQFVSPGRFYEIDVGHFPNR